MSFSKIKNINKTLFPSHYIFGPDWIILGVYNVCNLHCKMCDVGTKSIDTNFAQNLVGTHPINISLPLIKKIIDQIVEFLHKLEIQIGSMCNDIFTNVMIKSDGSVIPAHGRCYNLGIGNIYKNNLKEIWTSSVLSKFRSTLAKNCGLLSACNRCCSKF